MALLSLANVGGPGQTVIRITLTLQNPQSASSGVARYAGFDNLSTGSVVYTYGSFAAGPTYVTDFVAVPGQFYSAYGYGLLADPGAQENAENATPVYNFQAVTTPPSAINLSGSVSSTTVSLAWGTSQGATGYRLFRDGVFLVDTGALSYTEVRPVDVSTRYEVQPYTDNAAGRTYGAVSNSVTLQSNRTPTAPTPTDPVGNGSRDRGLPIRLSATFNDPDSGAAVSASTWRYRLTGAPAWTTSAVQNNGLRYFDIPAGLAVGAYEWQAVYADEFGLPSPQSSSAFFTAADLPPGPVITGPAAVTSATATLTWTVTNQDAYEVRKLADNAGVPADAAVPANVLYSSGVVESPSGRSQALTFPVNGRFEHLQVRVRYAGLFGPFTSVRREVNYTAPATPSVTLTVSSATASIAVAVTNPAPIGSQPQVILHYVHRREGLVGDGIRLRDFLTNRPVEIMPGGTYTDRTVVGGPDYAYRVQSIAANGTAAFSAWQGSPIGAYEQSLFNTAVYA